MTGTEHASVGAGSWPFNETTALIRTVTGARSRAEVLGVLCRRIRRGVTNSESLSPARSTTMVMVTPGENMTMSRNSSKRSMARPSIMTIRSPGWNPASSAAVSSSTVSMTAGVIGRPANTNSALSRAMESTKLASGPAATMATR